MLQRLVSGLGIEWMWGTHEVMIDGAGRALVTDPNPRICGSQEIAMLNEVLGTDYVALTLAAVLSGQFSSPPLLPDRYACIRSMGEWSGVVKSVRLPDSNGDAECVLAPKPGDRVWPEADLGTPYGIIRSRSRVSAAHAFECAGAYLSQARVEVAPYPAP